MEGQKECKAATNGRLGGMEGWNGGQEQEEWKEQEWLNDCWDGRKEWENTKQEEWWNITKQILSIRIPDVIH